MLTFFVNPIVREAPSRISTGVAKSSLPDLRNSIFSFAAELRFISHRHCQMGLTSFCLAHFFEMFSPQLRRASSLPAPVAQAPRSASAGPIFVHLYFSIGRATARHCSPAFDSAPGSRRKLRRLRQFR